jgi:hypothetical protein
MKTSHLVAAGVVVGALILIAKSRKQSMGDDDMLVPPPGRTLTASGQVLGGLGLETRFIDSYDACPYQYNRTPQNDFVPGINGFGSSLKKAVSGGAKVVSKGFSSIGKGVAKVTALPSKVFNTKALKIASVMSGQMLMSRLAASTVKIVGRTISNPSAGFKMATRGLKSFTITPLKQSGMVLGIIKPPKPIEEPGGGVEYQDANGNPISKADYDKMEAAAKASVPAKATDYKGYGIWTIVKPEGGTLYLINYRAEDNSTEGAYDTMAAAQAAIDAVVVPDVPQYQSSEPRPMPPASNYDQAKQAYDVMAAAREQASMSQASSDTGYGPTQQVTEEGAPQIPERIAQVQSPAAQMLPPQAEAAPAPSGNAKVGVLVGGGVLAAIAAALATR